MEFRTRIQARKQEPDINYSSKVLLVGSCFTEHIGQKLDYYKIANLQNPLGILYHPTAIRRLFERVCEGQNFSEADLIFNNERWHSLEAHSRFSEQDPDTLLENLNRRLREARAFLQDASHVVVTLGTAWGYRKKDTGNIAGNCHKLPQELFVKELVEVLQDLQQIHSCLQRINSRVKLIISISPVRHLRDGMIENQQSKARLITAVHELLEAYPQVTYFPAYEIMMDDLRDYRFYAADMLHPSTVAIDYIWEFFTNTWCKEQTLEVMEEVNHIQKALAHKPFNERSEAHQRFRNKLQIKIDLLRQDFPQISF